MIEIATRDEVTFTNDLLGEAKDFLRISHCDDDRQISMMIGAAVDQFERNTGITLFPTDYVWTVEDDFTDGSLIITPEQQITPVGVWSAWAPDDVTEVTVDYKIRRRGLHGVVFSSLIGAAQSGLSLKIASGYTAKTLPAGIRSAIFQGTSKLYEFRDILTPSNLQQMPGWLTHEIAGFWVPRV